MRAEGEGDESGCLLSKDGVRKGEGRSGSGERTEGGERGCLLCARKERGLAGSAAVGVRLRARC